MFDKNEIESIDNGKMLILGDNGIPQDGMGDIWFIWYRNTNNDKDDSLYRILLKTFTTKQCELINIKNALDKKFSQVGFGRWDMLSGRLSLLKP